MYKHILLTTDFSPEAERAVPFALELAALTGAPVDLLHVLEHSEMDFGQDLFGISLSWMAWVERERRRLRDELASRVEALRGGCKVNVKAALREGSAAHEIVEYATAEKIDCIVMATHGRSGISRFALGSVAERVVRHSPCAVLIVPGKIAPIAQPRIKKLESADFAMPWASAAH
jgi:nucleotide-binding universal stress UspA family protein